MQKAPNSERLGCMRLLANMQNRYVPNNAKIRYMIVPSSEDVPVQSSFSSKFNLAGALVSVSSVHGGMYECSDANLVTSSSGFVSLLFPVPTCQLQP